MMASMADSVFVVTLVIGCGWNLRPLTRYCRVHDFDGNAIRSHAYIFYCNPVQDIPVEQVRQHTVMLSYTFLLKFVHFAR